MTRHETMELRLAVSEINRDPLLAKARLLALLADADDEHAAEDAHHDRAESDTYPMNIAAE